MPTPFLPSRAVLLTILLALGQTVAPNATTSAPTVTGSADLRPQLATWKLEPRDQGPRGTCSVFAVTQALEFALARHEGKATRLSVEFLNWASNDAIGARADGGFFSDLEAGFRRHGICPESDCPYAKEFDAALVPDKSAMESARAVLSPTSNGQWRVTWIKAWNVTTGLSDQEIASIVATLDAGLPVCAGMRWPKAASWQGKRLSWADPADVFDGHSVLLVGHRPDEATPGQRVFLVRNSNSAASDIEITEAYLRAYVNDALWFAIDPRPSAPASAAGEGGKT
jgi:hypothetical protein